MRRLLLTLVVAALPQMQPQEMKPSDESWPLRGARLLPGYNYVAQPSDVCPWGDIKKKDGGGVAIHFSGGQVQNAVDSRRESNQLAWERRQRFGDTVAHVAMTKDSHLVVSYPGANFDAPVKSLEDVSDVLLMVLGYAEEPKGRGK